MSGIPHITHADVCTCAKCNAKANRIAAFCAIRRAAEVAREWDDLARFPFDLPRPSAHYAGNATAIRAVIRAAIGSPKA